MIMERGKGDPGRCKKQRSKKVYGKKRKSPFRFQKQNNAQKQPVNDDDEQPAYNDGNGLCIHVGGKCHPSLFFLKFKILYDIP